MVKKIMLILLIFPSFILFSQEKDVDKKPSVEIGYAVLFNSLNSDNYTSFKSSLANADNTTLTGVNLKFVVNSKQQFLDYFVGTIFMLGADKLGSTGWAPGNTASYDYVTNGGGVYVGISPKFKKKYFGFTSEFAVGIFSFKEYEAIYNNLDDPIVDIYDKKTSAGLGAMSSVGFYLRLGRFGISPSANAIFTGSSSASFLFYGFVFPLTFQF